MRKLTTEKVVERIKKIHGDKFDTSTVEYVNYDTPITLICPKHGKIQMTVTNLFKGKGCFKCYHEKPSTRRSPKEYVIKKVEEKNAGRFKILNFQGYRNIDIIELYCDKKSKNNLEHGSFKLSINNFLRGEGCPICKESKLENNIISLLQQENIEIVRQKTFDWLKYKAKQKIDVFLPQYNVAIECQGRQHFKPIKRFGGEEGFKAILNLDINKFKLCNEHGINLIYLFPKEEVDISLVNKEYKIYKPNENIFYSNEEIIKYIKRLTRKAERN